MLIETSNLTRDALAGDIAIVTGAGRGIGLETARALLWLGAKVVIAEIDKATGRKAAETLEVLFGKGQVLFVQTDVGEEKSVAKLAAETERAFGKATIVINNATVFPMGPVTQVPIGSWDKSYQVNLRGPVLMARTFLPEMIRSGHGTFVCVSSSGAAPFMGAYEVFKTSQVELSNTISAEMEGTKVAAFTIGPGIVATPGFLDGGGQVAAYMGMTTEELLNMNQAALLTIEEAGVGFAGSVALAQKYRGKEISSIQVLKDIGIELGGPSKEQSMIRTGKMNKERLDRVKATFHEQSEGWKSRNLFERQWVSRDFKKQTGMSIDEMAGALAMTSGDDISRIGPEVAISTLNALRKYYSHQAELLKGFEKDQKKLEDGLRTIDSWVREIDELLNPVGD